MEKLYTIRDLIEATGKSRFVIWHHIKKMEMEFFKLNTTQFIYDKKEFDLIVKYIKEHDFTTKGKYDRKNGKHR